jgi:hypothetical protein
VAEVARMLGGERLAHTSLAHAQAMLRQARPPVETESLDLFSTSARPFAAGSVSTTAGAPLLQPSLKPPLTTHRKRSKA